LQGKVQKKATAGLKQPAFLGKKSAYLACSHKLPSLFMALFMLFLLVLCVQPVPYHQPALHVLQHTCTFSALDAISCLHTPCAPAARIGMQYCCI
jgi:hypothetical protein